MHAMNYYYLKCGNAQSYGIYQYINDEYIPLNPNYDVIDDSPDFIKLNDLYQIILTDIFDEFKMRVAHHVILTCVYIEIHDYIVINSKIIHTHMLINIFDDCIMIRNTNLCGNISELCYTDYSRYLLHEILFEYFREPL